MALDFMRIISQGVYPTPTPTGASRMAAAVSQGLINFTLPTKDSSSLVATILQIGKSGIRFASGMFRIG